MAPSFHPGIDPPGLRVERAWVFACRGTDVVVREEVAIEADGLLYLGALEGVDCFATAAGDDEELQGLRGLYGVIDEEIWAVAGRAVQIVEWERAHRFCGACGTPTEPLAGQRARSCPSCGHLAFPRLSPAVIVLVRRGHEALLARGRGFPEPMYSCVAGFVEPGESLEEAVVREVREETGIEVRDVRYFGSQPWPFPHSLMIGFTAEYAGGEIDVEEEEILDAGWYPPDDLPLVPPPLSIARRLIDDWRARAG